MPKAEVGTPKYIANKAKSKGLQRLRWYCQVCEKQCRDENGFKCHAASESHLRQMLVVGEHAGKHIADFSSTFQSEFVALLSRRFGTKRVRINQVYQEYIADKNHLHMNSTRWVSLTEFCKHLGRTGVARVDETEKGWFLAWIDNSPKALAKAEASQKKERATTSDEQRERVLIAEQIERAAAEATVSSSSTNASASTSTTPPQEEGLIRTNPAEKVVLSFSSSSSTAPSTTADKPGLIIGGGGFKMGAKTNAAKPAVANPLKRPNVFKMASAAAAAAAPSPSGDGSNALKRTAPMTAAERLIREEEERKRRRVGN